jgi:putative membrane protein
LASQILEAMVHYAHIIGIITLGSVLLAEFVLLRDEITIRDFVLIRRVDLLYGIAAIVILVSGVMRVIWCSKGWEFYLSNGVFLTKMGAFVVLGLILIYPTVLFLRWGSKAAQGTPPPMAEGAMASVRRVVYLEGAIFVTIPLLGALMARGVGSF